MEAAQQGRSLRATGIGGPRNGMPPSRDYAYRGTGKDVLTPPGVMASWTRRVRGIAGERARDREVTRAEQEIALREAAAPVRPATARLPLVPLPAARPAPRRSPAPAPAPERSRAREAGPARCGSCGYLETAVGHKVACGGDAL